MDMNLILASIGVFLGIILLLVVILLLMVYTCHRLVVVKVLAVNVNARL